jgi:hypothetical protein
MKIVTAIATAKLRVLAALRKSESGPSRYFKISRFEQQRTRGESRSDANYGRRALPRPRRRQLTQVSYLKGFKV